jgi:TolB-like protein
VARIFLSYAHEDVAKAKSLAGSLERAGHSVWWDPHVGGGTRFAAEIATALRGCEVVVVLWSRHSIDSSWVQDEAAEGRDGGRLVPIMLDDNRPPLGFRQFQAIDLSGWSGRGRVRNLAAIESAIQTVLKGGTLAGPAEPPRRRTWTLRAIAAAVALLLVAVATLYITGRLSTRAEAASLAVLPFTDLSPTHDKAYFAEGVAEEVRTLLASVPGVRVIGETSIAMLGQGAGLKEVRNQLGVTHMLEGSMRIQGQQMRLDVRLLRTADGVQIWSERFDRDLKDIFKVQSEVGSAVADRLRARLWRYPLAEQSAPTSVQVYDLVLTSRSKMFEDTYESVLESNRLAEEATRLDPNYSPAWVERSRSIHAIDQLKPEGQWGPKWPAEYAKSLQYARRAVELDPNSGDAQAFLAWVETDGEDPELALRRIKKAMVLNPGESSVWGIAGVVYGQMCDRERQLEALRRWVALEPIDPWGNENLILDLYALGHDAEAEALKRKLPRPQHRDSLAINLAIDRSDFSTAIGQLLQGNSNGPALNVEQRQNLAYMLNALGRTDRAIDYLPSGHRGALGSYWRHDYQTAAAQTSFIATAQWNNLPTHSIERALVWTGRHQQLVDLIDKRFGSVAEFDRRMRCRLVNHAAPIVLALRKVGRHGEANRLIGLAERRYREALKMRENRPLQHVGYIELLLATGRLDEALNRLERALNQAGSRGNGPTVLALDLADPIYNAIRHQPRFKAVERRLAAWRRKELRELAAAGVKI